MTQKGREIDGSTEKVALLIQANRTVDTEGFGGWDVWKRPRNRKTRREVDTLNSFGWKRERKELVVFYRSQQVLIVGVSKHTFNQKPQSVVCARARKRKYECVDMQMFRLLMELATFFGTFSFVFFSLVILSLWVC